MANENSITLASTTGTEQDIVDALKAGGIDVPDPPAKEEPPSTKEEPPAKAAEVDEEGDEDEGEESEESDEDEDEKAKPEKVSRRSMKAERTISKLSRSNRAKDEQIANLTTRLEQLERAATAPPKKDEAAPALVKPSPDDVGPGKKYATYEDYVEALADYRYEFRAAQDREKAKTAEQDQNRTKQQQAADEAVLKMREAFGEKAKKFAETHPDYDEVLADATDMRTTATMDIFVLDSDLGPAIVYHLANNPEDFDRIKALPAGRQVKELTKLEQKLEAEAAPAPKKKAAAKPEKKAVSGAPAPPAKTRGTTSKAPASPEQSTNWNEWATQRQKELDEKAKVTGIRL